MPMIESDIAFVERLPTLRRLRPNPLPILGTAPKASTSIPRKYCSRRTRQPMALTSFNRVRRCLPKRRSFSSLLRSLTTRSMTESAKGASSSIARLRSRAHRLCSSQLGKVSHEPDCMDLSIVHCRTASTRDGLPTMLKRTWCSRKLRKSTRRSSKAATCSFCQLLITRADPLSLTRAAIQGSFASSTAGPSRFPATMGAACSIQ